MALIEHFKWGNATSTEPLDRRLKMGASQLGKFKTGPSRPLVESIGRGVRSRGFRGGGGNKTNIWACKGVQGGLGEGRRDDDV